VRRFERRRPAATAAAALAVALAANLLVHARHGFADPLYSTPGVAWFFALGWLSHRAVTPAQKLSVLALVLLLVPGYFGDPARDTVVTIGIFLLVLRATVPLPRLAAHVAGLLAGASLTIYLTHYAIFPALLPYLPLPAVLVACLAAGAGAWAAGRRLPLPVRQLRHWLRTVSASRGDS
jgi:hypothetical protein